MTKIRALRWRHFHFLLLAVYSCLFFYNRNADYFPESSVLPALRVAVVAALVLAGVGLAFWRWVELGALTGFMLVFFFLTFGHWIFFLGAWSPFAWGQMEQLGFLGFGLLFILWLGLF